MNKTYQKFVQPLHLSDSTRGGRVSISTCVEQNWFLNVPILT